MRYNIPDGLKLHQYPCASVKSQSVRKTLQKITLFIFVTMQNLKKKNPFLFIFDLLHTEIV